jgi:hypothetical protein
MAKALGLKLGTSALGNSRSLLVTDPARRLRGFWPRPWQSCCLGSATHFAFAPAPSTLHRAPAWAARNLQIASVCRSPLENRSHLGHTGRRRNCPNRLIVLRGRGKGDHERNTQPNRMTAGHGDDHTVRSFAEVSLTQLSAWPLSGKNSTSFADAAKSAVGSISTYLFVVCG